VTVARGRAARLRDRTMTTNHDSRTPVHAARRAIGARGDRRGNVLVLVAGVLVLLFIIGTAYLSRTRTEREVSGTVRAAGLRDDRAEVVRHSISREIAESLFVRPLDPSDPRIDVINGVTEDPNYARLAIDPFALRYSTDSNFPWNTASYSARPWTNWPDVLFDPLEGNAPRRDDIAGNPGTNDNRWLASYEPARWLMGLDGGPGGGVFGFDGVIDYTNFGADIRYLPPDPVEVFSHWEHLSNPMRPGNGWIVVPDITNIGLAVEHVLNGSAGPYNTEFGPYGTPVEQWISHSAPGFVAGAFRPATFDPSTGRNAWPGFGTWDAMWSGWFSAYSDAVVGRNGRQIPGNYFDLSDLNGNGIFLEPGERPQDEFKGPGVDPNFVQGTARWDVMKRLADADGDGYTDSLWYLAPASVDDEIRTLVAMRIVDASAMLNVNVASQYVRGLPNTPPNNFIGHGTRGWTPADLALYERPEEGLRGVGLLGSPEHWENAYLYGSANTQATDSPWGELEVAFNFSGASNQWDNGAGTILGELGLNLDSDDFDGPYSRLDYWRRSGSRPFDPIGPATNAFYTRTFTPFSLTDEVELRLFHASNTAWNMSRLERAFQNTGARDSILRGQTSREETSEYLDQLAVRPVGPSFVPFDEVLHDVRRMLTTHNGARNETMHPSLWWQNRWPINFNSAWVNAFIAQSRLKLDLREQILVPGFDVNGPNYPLASRLVWSLLTALSEGENLIGAQAERYYFGVPGGGDYNFELSESGPGTHEASMRLAAALTANILAYRDYNGPSSFGYIPAYGNLEDEAIRVPRDLRINGDNDVLQFHTRLRFLGMEMQPFLAEAFIGHVYDQPVTAQRDHPGSGIVAGDRIISGDPAGIHTVIAVQIANPYDRPLDLGDNGATTPSEFVVSVFGQPLLLTNGGLGPIPPGDQRTYWICSRDAAQFLDALDIRDSVVTISNLDVNNGGIGVEVWSSDRTVYDGGNAERAIEIRRVIPHPLTGLNAEVVIDRIDIHADSTDPFGNDFAFGEAITATLPNELNRPTGSSTEPPGNADWPNVLNLGNGGDDAWAQWARVSRDWDIDRNANNVVDANERNPRYVFAIREVETETDYRFQRNAATADQWLGVGTAKPTRFSPIDTATNLPIPNAYGVLSLVVKDKNITPPNLPSGAGLIELDEFSMQMVQKDGDFERIGEVLDVFTFGHMLRFTDPTLTGILDAAPNDGGTAKTFSEFMIDGALAGMDARVNRLRVEPYIFEFDNRDYVHSDVVGIPDTIDLRDERYGFPDVPAGARVLDLFVCDGPGYNTYLFDLNGDGTFGFDFTNREPLDLEDYEMSRFRNAQGFAGLATPGLLNINSTPREVLRSAPNMHRFVHETDTNRFGNALPHLNPANGAYQYSAGLTRLADAMTLYSTRQGDIPIANGGVTIEPILPMYGGRGLRRGSAHPLGVPDDALNLVRGDRGFESIGEPAMLDRSGRMTAVNAVTTPPEVRALWNESWRADFGARNPLRELAQAPTFAQVDMDVPTDVTDLLADGVTGNTVDFVAQDSEEANMLYSGISNLITTRSDVFVVYFKVRSVRRDPTTGVWDGTNADLVVDDTRYVMVVDRSEVNSVNDSPRILLFEQVSN
jgi:hypothetical protein